MEIEITPEDKEKLLSLIEQREQLNKQITQINRKYGLGVYCCETSESSNGWHHAATCKNYVLKF